jgi:hypothetical protein
MDVTNPRDLAIVIDQCDPDRIVVEHASSGGYDVFGITRAHMTTNTITNERILILT